MQNNNVITREFYARSPLLVAPEILGKVLVRKLAGQIITGRIVEVEAYTGYDDEAAHGFIGKTKRNASLFLEAGHAYVHSIHQQLCLDIVTESVDVPSGILLRALEPIDGIALMQQFRKKEFIRDLTSGPGKLTQALQITKEFDGMDITTTSSPLYVLDTDFLPNNIIRGKRIGISKATDKEFRFYLKDNIYVSR